MSDWLILIAVIFALAIIFPKLTLFLGMAIWLF